jgi:hypothetical protein
VDEGAAADLRPAVGGAPDLDVHLDPLDAERRVGFLNNALYTLFHVEGLHWLNDRWTAWARSSSPTSGNGRRSGR